jgi:hypothetical protein
MNSNWQQEFEIPIGADNSIEPGGPDQGQPTHFYPRRNPFLFTIRVAKDFGNRELIWTLTANGKTERAYASLRRDYAIDKQVISTEVGGDFGSLRDELRTNIPPELRVEGEGQRSVRVGEPLTLVAFARDPDNLPPRRNAPGRGQPAGAGGGSGNSGNRGSAPPSSAEGGARGMAGAQRPALPAPSSSLAARSGPGLRLSWMVYRGKAAAVTFDPDQMKTWMDTRPYANSPWSPPYFIPEPPPEGKWVVRATFQEPGSYVLRAVASDGSLFTYGNVTVSAIR